MFQGAWTELVWSHILSNSFWETKNMCGLFFPIIKIAFQVKGIMFVCQLLCRVQLCDPMDDSPPGSSVQGILQARVLEWVAISNSRGSSRSRDGTLISCLTGRGIYHHSLPRVPPGTLEAGIKPAQGDSFFGLTPLFCAKNLWESCVLRIIHEIRSVWCQSWEHVTWGKQEPPVGPHWVSGWPGSRPCTSSSLLVPPWPCYPLGSPSGLRGPDALGTPGFSLLSIYYFGGSVVKAPP